MPRYRYPQLQVAENYSYLFNLRQNISVFHLAFSNMAQRHVAFCERYVALHEHHVVFHERHVALQESQCHVALHVRRAALLILRQ